MKKLQLGTYHQAERIGEGTFGSVSTVYNDRGDQFAMKVFEADEYDETLMEETLREISILRILDKHNPVLEDIMVNEYAEICLIMPRLPLSLSSAVKHNLIQKKVPVLRQLVHALNFLHKNQIIHRDIKMDNIMFKDDEFKIPLLIDFSMAKYIGKESFGRTHTGNIGTAGYIAPEVYYKQSYSLNADIYSLGVVFLEVIIGEELKVDRDKAAFKEIEAKQQNLGDKPLHSIIRTMLLHDPHLRPHTHDILSKPPFLTTLPQAPDIITSNYLSIPGYMTSREWQSLVIPDVLIEFKALEFSFSETLWAGHVYFCSILRLYDLSETEHKHYIIACLLLASKMYETDLYDFAELPDTGIEPRFYEHAERVIFAAMEYCLYVEGPAAAVPDASA